MANLKCTIFWMVFLLAHSDLELVQGLSRTISTCPARAAVQCPPERSNSCRDDQDCEAQYPGKGYKCCEDCGKSCVTPVVSIVEVTPAQILTKLKILTKLVAKCPTNPPSSKSTPGTNQECQNDASCDAKFPGKGLKCCSDGYKYRCITPVVDSVNLPGYCPAPPPVNPIKCYGKDQRHECWGDADCEHLYPALKAFVKCCQAECRRRVCMIPIQGGKPPPAQSYIIPGTCPNLTEAAECPPEPDDECKNDGECQMLHPGLGLKCCKDGCDIRCVPPIPPPTRTPPSPTQPPFITPGRCPIFPEPAECPPEPHDECKNDGECQMLHPGLGRKCCIYGCDMRCVPPIAPPPRTPPTRTPPTRTPPTRTPPTRTPPTRTPPTRTPPTRTPPTRTPPTRTPSTRTPPTRTPPTRTPPTRTPPTRTPPTRTTPTRTTPTRSTPTRTSPPLTQAPFIIPGTCRNFPRPLDCPADSDDECKNDGDCLRLYPYYFHKCCIDGCFIRCLPPIGPLIPRPPRRPQPPPSLPFRTPGSCPPSCAVDCALTPFYECNNDEECQSLHPGLGLKCCLAVRCDMRCLPPIPPPPLTYTFPTRTPPTRTPPTRTPPP